MSIHRYRQRKMLFCSVAVLILVFVSGFRAYSVGTDTMSYVGLFNIADYIGESRYEVGFITYLRLLRCFSHNPDILLIVSGTICVGTVVFFSYQYSKNIMISIILYVCLGAFFMQMTGMRQALATAFLMQAFSLMLKKKNLLCIVLICLACSFHSIAIVALLPVVIWILLGGSLRKRLTPKTVAYYAIGIAAVAFVLHGYIIKIVPIVFPYYSGYLSSVWSDANYGASLVNTLIQIMFLLFGVFYFRDREFDTINLFAAMMLVFSVVFSALSMRMEIWSRVAGIFTIYTALLWTPNATLEIKQKYERLFVEYSVIVLSLLYMLVILILRPEWTGVVPYMCRKLI